MTTTKHLTHVDEAGEASMVDVGAKPVQRRRAVAEGFFRAAPQALDLVESGRVPKGEALAVARLAGIQAAKACDRIIPLCHALPLDHVAVRFERTDPGSLRIEAEAAATARTGVEMEALTAVAAAALALWDMTKAVDRDLAIDGIRLLVKEKSDF